MKQITEIHFVNYKGFYGDGPRNTVRITDAKRNLLIYGENGSGKSSICEGLRQFFEGSSDIFKNIRAVTAATIAGNSGRTAVEVTFTDDSDGTTEMKSYGDPNTIEGTLYIIEAARLNSFFSYKELLRTYLIENPREKLAFGELFTELVIETILAQSTNNAIVGKFKDAWDGLQDLKAMEDLESQQLEATGIDLDDVERPNGNEVLNQQLESFVIGLKQELSKINVILNDLLGQFSSGVKAKLFVMPGYSLEYSYNKRKSKETTHPKLSIGLEVSLYGKPLDVDDENHLTVLNEARLSSLAICIYLASLMVTPQEDLKYKILFLDDIFIGLDTSNRLPLMDILNNYRKPKTKLGTDGAGKTIEELDFDTAGEPLREERPFFESYQIFMTTYDRHWFEIAKQRLNPSTWHSIEMYAHFDEDLDFEVPLIMPSEGYFEKAEAYFWGGKRKDYPAAANYLRKELECQLAERLLYDNYKYKLTSNGETLLRDTLGDLWQSFCDMLTDLGLSKAPYGNFNIMLMGVLNPFSHSNLSKPIYRQELKEAFAFVDKIRSLTKIKVLNKGKRLCITVGDKSYLFITQCETYVYVQEIEGGSTSSWTNIVVTHLGVKPSGGGFIHAPDKTTEYSLKDAVESAYTEQGSDISTIGSVTSIVQMEGTTLDDILAQKLALEEI